MKHFVFPYNILLFYLLFKIYSVTILPGANLLQGKLYIDFGFLLFFFILNFKLAQLSQLQTKLNIPSFFLIMFFVFLFISTFYINYEFSSNLNVIIKIFIYVSIYIAFFFTFSRLLTQQQELFEKFLNFILIIALVSSLFSLMTLFSDIHPNSKFMHTTVGILKHPNTTSFIYTISIPIIIYKYFTNQLSSFVTIIFVFILFFCLLFTFSRAGYIAIFISVAYFSYSRSKKLFLVFILLLIFLFFTVIYDLSLSKASSFIQRFQLFLAAISLINASTLRMLWGYGVENAIKVFSEEKILFGNYEVEVNNPHNFILLLAIQFGLTSLFAYILFLISTITKAVRYKKRLIVTNDKYKLDLCISIILGLIFHNIFEEILVVPEYPVMALSLIFLGYLYNSTLIKQNNVNE